MAPGAKAVEATQNPWAESPKPPSERYAAQLATLRELGFSDDEQNVELLIKVNGNVNLAIAELIE